MAVKVTKGQICNGTISKIRFHKEYCLCGKFHNCFTKSAQNAQFLYYAAVLTVRIFKLHFCKFKIALWFQMHAIAFCYEGIP